MIRTHPGMIQRDADSLGLGVEVLGFTVGGMHPPVAVAKDYQAVVSAELRKVTAVVEAQVFRAQTLFQAEASAMVGENTARAEGAEALATAAGEPGASARSKRNITPRPTCTFTGAASRPWNGAWRTVLVTRFGRPLHAATVPGLHWKMPWPIDQAMALDIPAPCLRDRAHRDAHARQEKHYRAHFRGLAGRRRPRVHPGDR